MYLNKLLIIKKLLQGNTHLGLPRAVKNSRWSRFQTHRAQSYIFGTRGGQTILNIDKTIISLRRACYLIQFIIRSNGHFLFVNTNPKYNKIIQQTAKITNQSYLNHKWIGGFLTNWNHMQKVQQQFQETTKWTKTRLGPVRAAPFLLRSSTDQGPGWPASSPVANGQRAKQVTTNKRGPLPQDLQLAREGGWLATPSIYDTRYKKMQKSFEGLRNDASDLRFQSPDCLILFHASQNSTAIYEAAKRNPSGPIISLVDSNIPNDLYNLITYPIPANSESVQFIYLFCNCILKTILHSSTQYGSERG